MLVAVLEVTIEKQYSRSAHRLAVEDIHGDVLMVNVHICSSGLASLTKSWQAWA